MQTSTVTVAVIRIIHPDKFSLSKSDLEEFVTTGSGPGGQHRNKTQSCVTVRHKATGIECRADLRSQHDSRRLAYETVESKVFMHYQSIKNGNLNDNRRAQVGSGQRADKTRTYRTQDDLVIDHRSGKKVRLRNVLSGNLIDLIN